MRKLYTFIPLVLSILFYACNNNKGPDEGETPEPPVVQTYSLTLGNAVLVNSEMQTGIAEYGLTLESEMDAEGEHRLLFLNITVIPELPDSPLKNGTYNLSEDSGDRVILSTGNNYFEITTAEGKSKRSPVNGGSMEISRSGEKHTITGSFNADEQTVFKFEFDGKITGDENMVYGDIVYRSQWYRNQTANYILRLSNGFGREAELEIISPLKDDFRHLSDGKYIHSTIRASEFTLAGSDRTLYKDSYETPYTQINDGSLDVVSKEGGYEIKGTLEIGNNKKNINFAGNLGVTAAEFDFRNMDITCYGNYFLGVETNYLLQLYDCNKISSSIFEGPGVELELDIITPEPHYWETEWYYQNIPSGEYVYSSGGENFTLSDDEYALYGLFFHDSQAKVSDVYLYTGGSMKLTSTRQQSGIKIAYTYDIFGELDMARAGKTIVNGDEIYKVVDENDRLQVKFIFSGNVPDADYNEHHYCRPFSNMREDYNVTSLTKAAFENRDDEWNHLGAEGKSKTLLLILASEDADFENWHKQEEPGFEQMEMVLLSLNIPLDYQDGVLPTGTFTSDKYRLFEPFTFNPGTEIGFSNMLKGTGFLNRAYTRYSTFMDGEFVISESDGNYTVTFDCTDDGRANRHRVTGTYMGPIQYGGITD